MKFPFIKKYWLFILLATLAAVIFLQFTFQRKPAIPPSPTPTSAITFQNIQPGITSANQLQAILGQPISSKTQDGATTLELPSTYLKNPHVAVVKNDLVVLFAEKVALDKKLVLENYIDQFGQPDTTRYLERYGPGYSAHIFLKQGLLVVAYDRSGEVVELWYFQPMSIQELVSLAPVTLFSQPFPAVFDK